MRNNIIVTLNTIEGIKKTFPCLRIGQIISNFHAWLKEVYGADPFYMEDKDYSEKFEQYYLSYMEGVE